MADDTTTREDYIAELADAQYYANRDRRWLLPAAVLLLGLALGMDGIAAKTAACAAAAVAGLWLRTEIQWTGRCWYLHLLLNHEVIRPPRDLVAPMAAAMLVIEEAVQEARCSAQTGAGLSEEGGEA